MTEWLHKIWREQNKEKICLQSQLWYKNNKERKKKYNKLYYEKNKKVIETIED